MHPSFERLHDQGQRAVLTGSHAIETVPQEGGRWGPSALLLPGGELRALLGELTTELLHVAGRTHWPSGRDGRAHLTVRALEPNTSAVAAERVERYRGAVARTIEQVGAIELEFAGVALSPTTVLACATSPDRSGDEARAVLARELGADGWLEEAVFRNGRDHIWYCSLIHFAQPISEPESLVRWVAAHQRVELGRHQFSSIALCNWSYDGDGMQPIPMP